MQTREKQVSHASKVPSRVSRIRRLSLRVKVSFLRGLAVSAVSLFDSRTRSVCVEIPYRLTANCSTIRHDKCNTKGSVMTALTVRLNQFDSAMLEDLVRNTGESKTALVIDGLRSLYNAMREEDRVTRLSAQEFDAFLHQLEEGEKDPQVLLARERLMNIKPVWED